MRGAGHFLLGALLGLALGYAVSLVMAPSRRARPGPPARPAPTAERPGQTDRRRRATIAPP